MLIDQTEAELKTEGQLIEMMWRRREIENYLLVPEAILRFCEKEVHARYASPPEETDSSLFEKLIPQEINQVQALLKKLILEEVWANPLEDTPFLLGTKASDVVLEPFF